MQESTIEQREEMVTRQIKARGVDDQQVLDAMKAIPREKFIPEPFHTRSYEDAPVSIGKGQTISQPYIVAVMLKLLELNPSDRMLEVGSGSGYAAAVASLIVGEVFGVERHAELFERSRIVISELGLNNVHIRHGNGYLGWPNEAPFDAILVSAGGREVPPALKGQLKVGGVMVIPVESSGFNDQNLLRIRRRSESKFSIDDIGYVSFVPLLNSVAERHSQVNEETGFNQQAQPTGSPAIRSETIESFSSIEDVDLDNLLARVSSAKVVCIGEASHGTSEFYRMRNRITRELIEHRGFTIVAAEADWPDAAVVNSHVKGDTESYLASSAFQRFPQWMWRNREVQQFCSWLREHNDSKPADKQAGFYGLDLYSMYTSIDEVLKYLSRHAPELEEAARKQYSCLEPWRGHPQAYGRATTSRHFMGCEQEVVSLLQDLLAKRNESLNDNNDRYFDAMQNARVVAKAESYYRLMYYGQVESWNLRDSHMFQTLLSLLEHEGSGSRAVVWAHNSHLGDATATEMGRRGEINVGELCRREFGSDAYLIGFGSDHGTVACASSWNGDIEIKEVIPAHQQSHEYACHTSGIPSFLMPLRTGSAGELRRSFAHDRLERAIGVIYRPETELKSHYFTANLANQFDEYIWFDRTQAIQPLLDSEEERKPRDTYPFGL